MFELNGHLPDDYGCFHIHTEIASPEPRVEMLEIPLRDGALNTSALLSDVVHYSTREITLGLESPALREEWPLIQSALMRDFHGQSVQLVLDSDPDYYWEGWATVGQMEDKCGSAGWTINIQAQPFKKSRAIEEVTSITLSNGTGIKNIDVDTLRAYPSFRVFESESLTVEYNGVTYNLSDGTSTPYGLFFVYGRNVLTFSGTGTVNVRIRGGAL